jgi:hypothetical protein
MSTHNNDLDSIGKAAAAFGFRRALKWVTVCFGFLVASWFVLSTIGVVGTVATTGQRVINKTLDADNVINTYERFHDRWKAFESRKAQIRSYASIDGETAEERSRLRMEVQAMRQSCRDLAAVYNADSAKTNRSIFRGTEAPATLNMEDCNA